MKYYLCKITSMPNTVHLNAKHLNASDEINNLLYIPDINITVSNHTYCNLHYLIIRQDQ